MTVYDVSNVILGGSVRQGVLSSTWPLSCCRCFNCECEPTRRRYGGPFGDHRYCSACFGVIKRKDKATKSDRNRPETWLQLDLSKSMANSYSYWPGRFEIYRNRYIELADLRLAHLREIERKRQGRTPVDSADIDRVRGKIFEYIRPKVRKAILPSNDKLYLDQYSDSEHRRQFYILLTDLEECIQWKFPWWRAMDAVNEQRRSL